VNRAELGGLPAGDEAYRLLFAHVDSMVCTLDLEGRITSMNRAGEILLGYRAGELAGKLAVELIAPELREEAARQFARRLKARSGRMTDESVLVSRAGNRVPVEITSSLLTSAGRSTGVLGLVRDLTSQKSAENALHQSEERFRSAFTYAAIGMALVAPDGRWLQVNDALCDLVGYPAEQLVTQTFQDITHPDDLEADLELVRQMLAGEIRTYQLEKRYFHKLGHVVWILLSVSLVRAGDGSPLYFISQIQDITEQKSAREAVTKSEASLAEADARYRTLVEQLPLVTYIRPLDMVSENIYASPQVEQVLGYSPEEWTSNSNLLAEIVHPDDRERVFADSERVRRTGESVRQEYRYIAADGRVVWVLDETYVVRDDRGEPHSVQGYLLDITERKRAEEERDRLREELHHAQKLEAVGRLAGGVAHDFNNMLTAIKGYSELLIDGLEPDSSAQREAKQIRRAAEQASTLPRQLLAFSRKQVLQPRLVDLDEVVLATSELLERSVGETIQVALGRGSRSARVVVDPGQVEQALLNLALNARDAMPHGGTITISTDRISLPRKVAAEHEVTRGDYEVIAVTDTGHGMDAETTARVFEPFFTTKPVGQGSGLGLSTVYGMVRQSGGFVRVESAPGRGSRFEIYFPAVDAVGEIGAGADEPEALPVATAKVVLVEDEALVRDLAATALERAGYGVFSAASGAEALEHCDQADTSVDVLVTDVVMPGVGGPELAERVLSRHPETAVILMSGYADEMPAPDSEGRASSFLQKPFSPRDLVQAVADAVDNATSNGNGPEPHPVAPVGKAEAPSGITCLIADDHPAVLDSVSRYLDGNGFEVVSRVSRGDEALRELEALRPTIALLDVGMEAMSGIEVARQTAELSLGTRVVLYTGYRGSILLEQALDAGAHGFVLKEAPLAELVRALRIVANGGTYVDPELAGDLTSSRAAGSLQRITPREREVLALLADGMTNERAAAALGISAETVQSHVRNTMQKLEADTRTQAVATAIRESLIS
jgi:two-component system cell cycle sensor histidine kinase/response regulator CckA